jgi:conjugative transfer signal peptidase TraF
MKRAIRIATISLLAANGLCLLMVLSGQFVPNYTPSGPRGIYLRRSTPAEYALICLTREQATTALAAGVSPWRGSCPTGLQPLLKHLYAATPSHPVRFDGAGFWVAGVHLRNTQPLARSANGSLLSAIPFATYTEGLFAISTYNYRSYDSRYFGPLSASQIQGYATPFWVIP